ncbi:MAG: DUF4394 domain-containing protein [Candidatus Devosia phytovorans]|uniref:DUF4394 domain-containing protein n=1 Tax=Candidatus Devosia phytovorans TaxID=3121372 RepID=A0AAJ6B085_9HYPH|nr:DUF4394 domain-containing protein [Devosia sp.]WEK05435.1 MAG: DUF4394 domain-containing protein [Devosia sp.]
MTATSLFALRAGLVASTLVLGAAAAHAAPAIGLVDGTTLVMFDTETRAVSGTMEVSGVDGLAGIDVRPADKMLYGVSLNGEVVTIDTTSGEATVKSTLSEKLASYEGASIDFNPMADRLRIVGTDGTNHRANVDDGSVTVDGSLAYDAADMHAGEEPAIVAVAYTNSIGKPEATAMYDIDATIVALIQQAPPNDGVLKAVGKLGVEGGSSYAFDIAATEDLTNTAYLVVDNALHTVDLETGAAEAWGAIEGVEGSITDIAILQ